MIGLETALGVLFGTMFVYCLAAVIGSARRVSRAKIRGRG